MKSKRIIDIETRVLPNGVATCSQRENYDAPDESKKTAAAKLMYALNSFCQRHKVGFYVIPHDSHTNKPLTITFTEVQK